MAPKASKAAPVGGTPPRPSPQKVSDPPAPVPTPQQPSKERPDPKKKGYAKLEEGVEEGRPWSNATEAAMERHQTKQAASKTSHPQQLCRALVSFLMATRLPLVYYSLGCAFYWYVEGWAPLDTVYFLTVTSTTVGYGDISPVSTIGKLFTCFYALVGITGADSTRGAALSPSRPLALSPSRPPTLSRELPGPAGHSSCRVADTAYALFCSIGRSEDIRLYLVREPRRRRAAQGNRI